MQTIPKITVALSAETRVKFNSELKRSNRSASAILDALIKDFLFAFDDKERDKWYRELGVPTKIVSGRPHAKH